MNDVPSPSAWRAVVALIRNQPVRYTVSLALWTTMWSMPILVGVVVARFFDSLAGGEAGWNMPTLVAAVWAWALARVCLVFLGMRNHSNLLFRANAGMKRAMLAWIYGLPAARPVDATPGEVVSRFRDDVEHVVEAFDFTVDLVGSTISAAFAFAILFAIDPLTAVVVFAPVAVVIVIVSRTGTRVRRYRRSARESTEAITGFLGETFGSVQSVKVAGAERPMLEHFTELNETRRTMMVRDRTFTAVLEATFENTVNIGTGLILVLAAASLGTPSGLTIGEFSLFVFLLKMVTDSAFFLGLFIARLKQAGVSIERIVSLMRGASWEDVVANVRLDDAITARTIPDPTPEPAAPLLEVRGLGFRYPESGSGIEDVDLTVGTGEFVVLTGKIGAGKTTLLRAILGMVDAEAGSIRWKGADVADPATFMVPPRSAYTPQVPRLFSMSLRDNLLLGQPAGDEELASAIRTVALEHDLEQMADGLEALVGPRGVRLSGGQIQRAAAARMLVRAPELLVFDDLSSALDVETEATLWDRLFSHERATALVVSHRRPALMRADQILVLHEGRVADRGTADELLTRSALFRELWGSARNGLTA